MLIKKTFPRPDRRGFSLLELLLVMALLPIVSFAVFSNFSAGFRVWARVMQETPEEDLQILQHKVRRDLLNMRRYADIPFEGDSEWISFAAAIEAAPELGGTHGIGQIRLFYDASKDALVREVRDLSQIYQEDEGRQTVLMQGVDALEFSFFWKDPLESGYVWTDSWKPDPANLPTAIRISFSAKGSKERQEQTIFIPVGGLQKQPLGAPAGTPA